MIADFVIEKMSGYIAGGMSPQSAAHFTRGELEAIYKGNHWSRDAAGVMQQTTQPEPMDTDTAMKKCAEAINEILRAYAEMASEKPADIAPESIPRAALKTENRNGLEGLKDYTRREPA
jgi:hypothetical protein